MTSSIDQTSKGSCYRAWAYYLFDVITLLREFSIGHLQRVQLADRGHLLLQTPGPVQIGTCICSNVETILIWACHVYGTFWASGIPRYLYFALSIREDRKARENYKMKNKVFKRTQTHTPHGLMFEKTLFERLRVVPGVRSNPTVDKCSFCNYRLLCVPRNSTKPT